MQINYRLISFILVFITAMPMHAFAWLLAGDTASYTSHTYQVEKKKERVSDIAKKLKANATLISSMNDGLSMDSILTKGQSIRVPLYYNPDTQGGANKTNKQAIKGKSIKSQPAKTEGSNQSSTNPTPVKTYVPPIDTELIQTKILLAQANLELNQALLQGIQASLDSLNVTDKKVVDSKNIQATIHSMQRQRDKTLLTPFLLHMQDSLTSEIKTEEEAKSSLENILGYSPGNSNNVNNIASSAHTQYATAAAQNNTPDTAINASPDNSVQPNKAPDKLPVKPTKAPKVSKVTHADNTVTSNSASLPLPVGHWETAKALYYNDDASPADPSNNDSTFAEIVVDESQDTSAYIPAIALNTDAQPVMSDSVRYTKALLFLTKAMKASNDRNYKSATQYLKKAIDLIPRYYDAWFALGEADAHLGLLTKALNEYKTCATIDSSKAALFYKMGSIQIKLKLKTDAGLSFNRSLMLDSNYIPAIMGIASVNMEKKKYKTAIKEYTHVLEIDWGYHTAYRSRGMAQYWLKNYEGAVDDFTRYIIFDETDASVYFYRGMAKAGLDELADACADFSNSAKLGYAGAAKAMEANCK